MIKCYICGSTKDLNEDGPKHYRCDDVKTCYKNKKETRIYSEEEFESNYIIKYREIAISNFVVIIDKKGGAKFIKDRYEISGKTYFTEY